MFSGRRLHEIFQDRAARFADRVAVSAPDGQLSYAELNARADRLADRLRALGVGPDVLVGLCAERGLAMIVGLLGILKAGGAYVPVDPTYPVQRIRFLLADSAAPVLVASRAADRLTQGELAAGDTPVLWIDDEAAAGARPVITRRKVPPGPGNLAYVIYTSGSTGTPKGVLVEHRNVVRLFEQAAGLFGFSEQDTWAAFHSISFDFSVWEMWGALLYGGRVVIVPAGTARSADAFLGLVQDERVTVLNQTPSAFRQFAAAALGRGTGTAGLPALRLVIFGGERLDVKLLEPWIAEHGDERPELVNMYGITETTVHVTHRRIRAADLAEPGVSPIGRPLGDLRIHLLDEAGRPVPDGKPGEIHVSGAGVARGYLGRPGLTADRFIDRDGVRLYRSGDRALRAADGEYAYLGRLDDQMKVRGFRIEPGEIEACLAGHPGTGQVIVTQEDYDEGDVRLAAYLVPPPGRELAAGAGATLAAQLADRARRALPPYMWPSSYRVVSEIPLTAQGKVDRAALGNLPYREFSPDGAAGPADGPLTATEQAVLEISRDIMQRPGIGVDDELFDAGATSLAFMRILTAVNQRFGVTVTGAELEEATVRLLAGCVDEQRMGDPQPVGR